MLGLKRPHGVGVARSVFNIYCTEKENVSGSHEELKKRIQSKVETKEFEALCNSFTSGKPTLPLPCVSIHGNMTLSCVCDAVRGLQGRESKHAISALIFAMVVANKAENEAEQSGEYRKLVPSAYSDFIAACKASPYVTARKTTEPKEPSVLSVDDANLIISLRKNNAMASMRT